MTAVLTSLPRRRTIRPGALFPVGIVAFSILMLAGASFGQQKSKTSPSTEGHRLFTSMCAACHGLDARGGERAPDIATRRTVQRMSDDAIAKIIQQGIPGTAMPGFQALASPQVQSLVKELRNLQGAPAGGQLPGDREKGKAVFFGKAGCSECHMVNGQGGFLGADLTDYAAAESPADIREAIVNPGKILSPHQRRVAVTTTGRRRFEGIIRNEDNFSLQLQDFSGGFHLFERSQIESVEYLSAPLMPTDYGTRLSQKELDDLVSFLAAAGNAKQNSNATAGKKRQAD